MVLIYQGTNHTDLFLRINSDTGSNYSLTRLFASGTSAFSDRSANQVWSGVSLGGATSAIGSCNFMNYSNTTTYKSFISRLSNPGSYVGTNISLWRSTSAITTIDVITQSGYMNTGITFTLYGIKAA